MIRVTIRPHKSEYGHAYTCTIEANSIDDIEELSNVRQCKDGTWHGYWWIGDQADLVSLEIKTI